MARQSLVGIYDATKNPRRKRILFCSLVNGVQDESPGMSIFLAAGRRELLTMQTEAFIRPEFR